MKNKNFLMNFFCSVTLLLFSFNGVAHAAGSVTLGPDVIATLTEITQVLLVVAAGVCVGKVIHIGILYASSVAMDKSNAKSAILPWLIGTFICFGAAVIGPAIISIFDGGPLNVLDY